ncbi:uncharacterized protein [Palaemon carinicauda]|uniref:uncharacterized protein n=1 Tax=Palaemon carinicauda TaxID=392227 RepID=UPI0035B5993E
MMKLIVLAVAVAAVSAGTVLTGFPLTHGAYPLGLTGALPYSGLTGGAIPIPTTHIGSPLTFGGVPTTYGAVPTTYVAGPATALVNPAPYQIHTGVRADVSVEPVEQHGYVIKY